MMSISATVRFLVNQCGCNQGGCNHGGQELGEEDRLEPAGVDRVVSEVVVRQHRQLKVAGRVDALDLEVGERVQRSGAIASARSAPITISLAISES